MPGRGHHRLLTAHGFPNDLVQVPVGGGVLGGEVKVLGPLGAHVSDHIVLFHVHLCGLGPVAAQIGRGLKAVD